MARPDSTLGSLLHDADMALIEEKVRRRERAAGDAGRRFRPASPVFPLLG
jgi:hypothetical protein